MATIEAGLPPDVCETQHTFHERGYLSIPSVFPRMLMDIALRYYLSYVGRPGYYVVKDTHKALDRYADALSEAMMPTIQQTLERSIGLALLPTYSFARIYTTESTLTKHVDRGACEISATMTIGCRNVRGLWPIYVEKDGKAVGVELSPGDVLAYRGMELPHWREPLSEGIWCQVFFHFVQKGGRFADQVYDGRGRMGPLTDDAVRRLALGEDAVGREA